MRRYLAAADDLHYDSGMVDTFLHPQDRAYTVPQVLEFAHSNGLAFWSWIDPKDYNADSVLGLKHPALARIQALPIEEQWATVELIAQTRGTHRFLLCHPERLPIRPRFESASWLHFVPVLHPLLKVTQQGNIAQNQPAILKREWQEFPLNRIGMALLEQINGKRSIAQILEEARKQVSELTLEHARDFFSLMQDWGHVMYWLGDEKSRD